ncbi:MAG: hypothetical protein AB1390_03885 [Nitrospirota bacterium]
MGEGREKTIKVEMNILLGKCNVILRLRHELNRTLVECHPELVVRLSESAGAERMTVMFRPFDKLRAHHDRIIFMFLCAVYGA